MTYQSMSLVFVINLTQCLICRITNHTWKHKLKVLVLWGQARERANMREDDRGGWNRSVLPPMAMLAWPSADVTPADDSPTKSENPCIRGQLTHTQLLYCIEILLIGKETAACPVLICNIVLLSPLSKSVLQRRVNSFSVRFHQEHKPTLAVISKKGGSASLAIHSTLIQITNPPKNY